ncbi:L-idonate 5-dehydrogenase [Sesbania bispinosa]|nr:L-idonate 5-dehydrogenase [Sesbania bispinosa]
MASYTVDLPGFKDEETGWLTMWQKLLSSKPSLYHGCLNHHCGCAIFSHQISIMPIGLREIRTWSLPLSFHLTEMSFIFPQSGDQAPSCALPLCIGLASSI